ncbi:MAG: hypothetical protein CMI53_03005 [Parcubacteria group bacterium]|nr:hypothetical protein [Parcubacteria group bacterium]
MKGVLDMWPFKPKWEKEYEQAMANRAVRERHHPEEREERLQLESFLARRNSVAPDPLLDEMLMATSMGFDSTPERGRVDSPWPGDESC